MKLDRRYRIYFIDGEVWFAPLNLISYYYFTSEAYHRDLNNGLTFRVFQRDYDED